ncbi:hypothetical protein IMG5_013150 [Ichthyophthirius multifiliis]|uniref:Transmembrane protein n=1 Tax=Ichthyophthirius multifiliis TaxID=5932 RepID=G0QK52_ICHMU|nr:hypothetical protein IMG5_013150 [Ichthyophthirius multifiliis]EGR34397.1 hypothetical protein IMG5_013150 [Ichthyophthirius multifiliis]|eukprot:XP_004039701.1 hypothetical protein IMG5_013150 [Ichthyophthirius multifiliis]
MQIQNIYFYQYIQQISLQFYKKNKILRFVVYIQINKYIYIYIYIYKYIFICQQIDLIEQQQEQKVIKCHFSCLDCVSEEYSSCTSCSDSRLLHEIQNGIGECICYPNLIEIGENECSDDKKYLNFIIILKSFYTSSVGINLFISSISFNPLFYLGLSEFTQSISHLNYINQKSLLNFDSVCNLFQYIHIAKLYQPNAPNTKKYLYDLKEKKVEFQKNNKAVQVDKKGNQKLFLNDYIEQFLNNGFLVIIFITGGWIFAYLGNFTSFYKKYLQISVCLGVLFCMGQELCLLGFFQFFYFDFGSLLNVFSCLFAVFVLIYFVVFVFFLWRNLVKKKVLFLDGNLRKKILQKKKEKKIHKRNKNEQKEYNHVENNSPCMNKPASTQLQMENTSIKQEYYLDQAVKMRKKEKKKFEFPLNDGLVVGQMDNKILSIEQWLDINNIKKQIMNKQEKEDENRIQVYNYYKNLYYIIYLYLNQNSKMQRGFLIVLFIKKCIISSISIFIYKQSQVQIILMSSVNFCFFCYVFLSKPFLQKKANFIYTLQEFISLNIHILYIVICYEKKKEIQIDLMCFLVYSLIFVYFFYMALGLGGVGVFILDFAQDGKQKKDKLEQEQEGKVQDQEEFDYLKKENINNLNGVQKIIKNLEIDYGYNNDQKQHQNDMTDSQQLQKEIDNKNGKQQQQQYTEQGGTSRRLQQDLINSYNFNGKYIKNYIFLNNQSNFQNEFLQQHFENQRDSVYNQQQINQVQNVKSIRNKNNQIKQNNNNKDQNNISNESYIQEQKYNQQQQIKQEKQRIQQQQQQLLQLQQLQQLQKQLLSISAQKKQEENKEIKNLSNKDQQIYIKSKLRKKKRQKQ